MFDLILHPRTAEKRPSELLLFALALGFVSSWLAMIITKNGDAGHLTVALMCIGAAPLIVHLIWLEEQKGEKLPGSFLERHLPLIQAYGAFFVGTVLAISMIYVLLPDSISQTTFASQINELKAIRTLAVGGKAVGPGCDFFCILYNNLQVLLFVLIFSFIYGAGAIYVITWNASIVGVLIGVTTEELAKNMGIHESLAYLLSLPMSFVRLIPHGIFEISGYLIGGLAGGMLSAALMRGHLKEKRILLDISGMILLSVVLIVIGAFIETLG